MAFSIGKNVINFTKRKMADTSKDELLLGGGIRHIAASSDGRSSRAEVSKFLLAYIGYFNTLNAFIFGNISSACAKEQITATYYCQVEVKVCDRIGVVISEIIGLSGRHFSAHFLW